MNTLKRLVVHVMRERDALSKQIEAWDHARGWKFDGRDPSEVGNLPEAEWKNRERWARDLETPAPESLSELVAKLRTHNGFTEFDNLDRDVISAGVRLNLGAGVETDLNDLRRARYAMISAVCDMMTSDGPSSLFGVESVQQLNEALTRLMRRVPAFDIAEQPKGLATTDTTPEAARTRPKVEAASESYIIIGETRFEIDHAHAVYLKALVETGDWLSDPEFRESHPVYETDRQDRWRKKLPRAVAAHIETTSRGSRWTDAPMS